MMAETAEDLREALARVEAEISLYEQACGEARRNKWLAVALLFLVAIGVAMWAAGVAQQIWPSLRTVTTGIFATWGARWVADLPGITVFIPLGVLALSALALLKVFGDKRDQAR